MNAFSVKIIAAALIVLALMGGSAGAAWEWQANVYGKTIATNEANHQADLTAISNAAAAQSRQAVAKQQAAEQAVAMLDQKSTQEKETLNAENESLRRAVADGTRRLRIAGSCSAGSSNVPGTAIASSLGDAGTIELSAASGQAVLDLRRDIITDQAALRAAQAYIREVCR